MSNDDKPCSDKESKREKMEILSTEMSASLEDKTTNLAEGMTAKIEPITEEHLEFYSQHAGPNSYNPLESKIDLTGGYCVTIRKGIILAILISIPHQVFIHGLGLIKTVLSTYLLVHTKFRTMKLAQVAIMATVREGYLRGIKIGYHWIGTSKTIVGIETKSWYRPLIPKKAKVNEYELMKGADYSLPVLEGYIMKPTIIENFMKISSNKLIKLAPTEEGLTALSNVITFLTVYKDEKIVGIVGYRHFTIVKPHLKVHPVQLCYFDSTSGLEVEVLTILFNKLKKDGIIAVHGVVIGGIDKAVTQLNLSLAGNIILDFYNLTHNVPDCSRVSMLYV